ncbi:GNAT family N-acetyltransferase [Massilia sp. YIM B02763]|uniref:GNAT family N-acetyltransferase n=1 Tax=Massilia sp. YIM B02763 TaxID=3050130 RepID=UPI0025B67225|nr:GNAT family N-acetyltransferase [Massilia sp. YIM B02763]MDN4052148.1 GNAT family N-acetyltransferase [Massilia sp. YIM B02763]
MNYRTHIASSLSDIGREAWDGLVALQDQPNPFLSFSFLDALHDSGSAAPDKGWQPQFIVLYEDDADSPGGERLAAALPLYVKGHSYGEYVFDWAWADAYQRNGLEYYPKLLSAIPFTPVTGPRLLARDDAARHALVDVLRSVQQSSDVSSTHVLFPPGVQAKQLEDAGFLLRSGVQFHWENAGYATFEDFLATLEQKKRKNIRAERRKVREAGVLLRRVRGTDATDEDWRFFTRCYRHTYAEHYSTPYLNLDFFRRIGRDMPQHLLLVIAERDGSPIAASLVVHDDTTLYGRYWGALEHVPCLHFETAYYQPLEFCIEQKIQVFEGGAQGEHKMARGFLPTRTWSAHWLKHPSFSDAVEKFLEREAGGIDDYIDELNDRSPFKTPKAD